MTEQKKYFRVLDGGSHGGVERGLVYYCEEYGATNSAPETLHLKGVVRIEAVDDDMDFHTNLTEPADMSVSTDGSYETSIATLPA